MCTYCDRNFPNLGKTDFSRRSFLRNSAVAAAAGAIVMAVPRGFGGPAIAAGLPTLKTTHGGGLCNAGLFAAHLKKLGEQDGLTIQFVETPNFADMVTFIGTGQVDVSLMPYTSFMALYDAGAPVKIVAGGGVMGCALVAQPGLDTPEKIKGKTIGTFQLDTTEVLAYDWLKKHGIKYSDVNVRYLGGNTELVEAFKSGSIDVITEVEPLITQAMHEVPGSVLLTDGTDIYGQNYTDCVVVARTELLQSNPAAVQTMIKALFRGQALWESDRPALIKDFVGAYYRLSAEDLTIAAEKQRVRVDQREQEEFILNQVNSLVEMGYIKKKPGKDAVDWSFLEAAIKEIPDVYARLKSKSA